VSSSRRPTYFPWVFCEVPEVFRWSPNDPGRDGTVCTNSKPPQSCFWVTIICFYRPQCLSILSLCSLTLTGNLGQENFWPGSTSDLIIEGGNRGDQWFPPQPPIALPPDVSNGSKADVTLLNFDVLYSTESRHCGALLACQLWAISRHRAAHSITSSAGASSEIASVLAVFRLMTRSTFTSCWTGSQPNLFGHAAGDPRAAATQRRRLVGIIIAAGMDHN
jgi:hypothetical protein